jgi:DNA-binding NarL/FixJ family response regulator
LAEDLPKPVARPGQSGQIRVLVADDHPVVRRGIIAYLDMRREIVVVDEAVNGRDALEKLHRLATDQLLPRVVVMDLVMPEMSGVAATVEIGRSYPEVRVLILTSFSEIERVNNALEAGAAGYLLKEAGSDEIAEAICAVARDQVYLHAAVTPRILQRMLKPNLGVASLSHRERDVLTLVGKGLSNREIADALGITERTARTHVVNILGKLGVSSRTQAALVAIYEGLVPYPA